MAQSQFSLSWDAHKKNICCGLSSLQQNGEFVDMTLAADGHHVKVHQVIMALASPYIKELMSTAQCPHPVIFLNKISYTTLSSILEYVYTGEVLVSIENLKELVEAGKELHIKGLEDMKLHPALSARQTDYDCSKMEEDVEEDIYFEITTKEDGTNYTYTTDTNNPILNDITRNESAEVSIDEETFTDIKEGDIITDTQNITTQRASKIKRESESSNAGIIQYTVSNQGSLQMILNRFVYYLKHTNRDGSRQWRCVAYLNSTRCPALVVTRNDVVTQRISAHTHAFHDKKILKKVHAGAIFTAIHDAVVEGQSKKEKATANSEDHQSE